MNVVVVLQLLWLIRQLRPRDRWTRGQLEAHQSRSLRLLREYAYAHSPFYQRFHRGFADRPLAELPVLTKAHLMEHFDDLVTDRDVRLGEVEAHVATIRGDERFRDRYSVCATSGSTGRPGLFLFDRSEWLMILASFARAHEWAGIKVGLTHRMRLASVASTVPWHMSARVAATFESPWIPALRLDATDPMDTTVARLNAWQPEMLVAYPSVARILAGEQESGRLCISPRLVFTSAEVLTEETRRRVEEVWGRRLFNQYGTTESGELAAECDRHTGMHLCEDLVITEVVDADNRPVPPGVYGDKLLITVLFSRTQPLIRYELSDSMRLTTVLCPCGRPFALVDGIQGRAEEVLHFPSRAGGQVAVHPNLFHRVMDAVPTGGWQVVQEPDGLKVLLSGAREGFVETVLVDSLRQELVVQGALVPPIRVERVPAIPRGLTGKAPLVKSNAPASASQSSV